MKAPQNAAIRALFRDPKVRRAFDEQARKPAYPAGERLVSLTDSAGVPVVLRVMPAR